MSKDREGSDEARRVLSLAGEGFQGVPELSPADCSLGQQGDRQAGPDALRFSPGAGASGHAAEKVPQVFMVILLVQTLATASSQAC